MSTNCSNNTRKDLYIWIDGYEDEHTTEKMEHFRKTDLTLKHVSMSFSLSYLRNCHEHLTSILQFNNTVVNLDLSNNHLGGHSARAISTILAKNSTLEKLDLGENRIGDEGVKLLMNSLQSNKSLSKLVLSCNFFGDEGAKSIANLMYPTENLLLKQVLGEVLHSEAAEMIADELTLNTTLKYLDISCNNIGDKGARLLANALEKNFSLETLLLYYSEYSTEGSKSIAQALHINATLKELDIDVIDDNNIAILANSLLKNASLQTLRLSKCKFTAQGAFFLANMIQANNTLHSLEISFGHFMDIDWIDKDFSFVKEIICEKKKNIPSLRVQNIFQNCFSIYW